MGSWAVGVSAGAGLAGPGLGREWGGRGQEFCDWNLIF